MQFNDRGEVNQRAFFLKICENVTYCELKTKTFNLPIWVLLILSFENKTLKAKNVAATFGQLAIHLCPGPDSHLHSGKAEETDDKILIIV